MDSCSRILLLVLIGRVHRVHHRCSTIIIGDGSCKYMLPPRSGLSLEGHLVIFPSDDLSRSDHGNMAVFETRLLQSLLLFFLYLQVYLG